MEPPDQPLPGQPLKLDPAAASGSERPAFPARPPGTPVYHGFPLAEESRTPDGWCFGVITDPDCPEGGDWGDAYVVAPDGSRAGIVWQTGLTEVEVILGPDDGRWGVYGVPVSKPIRTQAELVAELSAWLPTLRRLHDAWAGRPSLARTPPAHDRP